MEPVKLSVRRIVDFLLRAGDIDSCCADASVMAEGAKAHRKIQKQQEDGYCSEVSLKLETEIGGIPVLLQGRADGVRIEADGTPVIHEIKTTILPLQVLALQKDVHYAQAACYAWMYLMQEAPAARQVRLWLTGFQLETEERYEESRTLSRTELTDFFHTLMDRYAVWLRLEREWRQVRDASIRAAVFPFPAWRPMQRRLAVAVYRTIGEGKNLFVQAPTGIGKTISTIFPAMKALEEGGITRILYLTAKTVTRTAAEEAIFRLADRGLRFRSLTLRAKEKICFQETVSCTPESCPQAQGHYDRVNDALLDILQRGGAIRPEEIACFARRHRVCPYELMMDLTDFSDMIVGDYNHVFDPGSSLAILQDPGENPAVLIDEAHNLPDRVRDMYSAALRKSDFLQIKRLFPGNEGRLIRRAAERINRHLLAIRKNSDRPRFSQREADAELGGLLAQFVSAAEFRLSERRNTASAQEESLRSLLFQAVGFLSALDRYDEHYCTMTEIHGSEVIRTVFCLDPSAAVRERTGPLQAAVFFSATLTPLSCYRQLLGAQEEDGQLILDSPFDSRRLLLLIHAGISTRYRDRQDSLEELARAVGEAVSHRTGNYIVYFPSYEYLQQTFDVFTLLYPGTRTICQQSSMDEIARQDFLGRFQDSGRETLVGFCVLGGIFGEGIDLMGERLIGAVIIGPGLPKLSLRQDLIRDYFEEKLGAGYDYAYLFPGLNKVLQAAGRVIRTETDYGLVLLIDSRFAKARYQSLFPAHWSHLRCIRRTDRLSEPIRQFFAALPPEAAAPDTGGAPDSSDGGPSD